MSMTCPAPRSSFVPQAMFSRESFIKTKPTKEHLIAGWAAKVPKPPNLVVPCWLI
jgi:glutathione dehydrogenase/transferase